MVSLQSCLSAFVLASFVQVHAWDVQDIHIMYGNETADSLCKLLPVDSDKNDFPWGDYMEFPYTLDQVDDLFPRYDGILNATYKTHFKHKAAGVKCLKDLTSAYYQPRWVEFTGDNAANKPYEVGESNPLTEPVPFSKNTMKLISVRFNFKACTNQTATPTPTPTPGPSTPTPSNSTHKKVKKSKKIKKTSLLSEYGYKKQYYDDDDDYYYDDNAYDYCSCQKTQQVQAELLIACDVDSNKNLDFNYHLFNVLKYTLPKKYNGNSNGYYKQ